MLYNDLKKYTTQNKYYDSANIHYKRTGFLIEAGQDVNTFLLIDIN